MQARKSVRAINLQHDYKCWLLELRSIDYGSRIIFTPPNPSSSPHIPLKLDSFNKIRAKTWQIQHGPSNINLQLQEEIKEQQAKKLENKCKNIETRRTNKSEILDYGHQRQIWLTAHELAWLSKEWKLNRRLLCRVPQHNHEPQLQKNQLRITKTKLLYDNISHAKHIQQREQICLRCWRFSRKKADFQRIGFFHKLEDTDILSHHKNHLPQLQKEN